MNSNENIEYEAPFQIIGLEVVEVCFNKINESKGKGKNEVLTQNKFSFQISLIQQADIKNNIIVVIPTIIIQSGDSKIEYATITVKSVFLFKDLSPFLIDKQLDIPRKFTDRISSIAISSSRGIMFSELSTTYLKNAILPIIDVSIFEYNKMELDNLIS
jgi:hypothetical protein